MTSPRVLVSLGLVALGSSLHAQTLVEYAFTSSSTAVTASGANVTTTPFARGAGLSSVTLSNGAGFPSANSIFVTSAQVNEAISATSTDWLGFTISATTGNVLNLSGLSFYYAYTNTSGTISGSATFDVRSSVDNYATSISSFTIDVANSTTPNWTLASIGLTAAPYQNLQSVSFRIFLNDGANESGNSQLRLDTVTLTGVSAAPVPEPASAAVLAGLCGLGLAAARRRRTA